MRPRNASDRVRRGASLVEAAIVLPVVSSIVFGTVVLGIGIYLYEQVASLAREGARQASVHGTQWAIDTSNTAWTATDIKNNAVLPMAVGLNSNNLTVSASWNLSNSPTSYNPNSTPPGAPVINTVSVTVSYSWTPALFLTGPINLSSTSVMPMSY
jgi:Flp pilus assembly protein TadG